MSLVIQESIFQALRSAELLLILAGTSLVVALIVRTKFTAIMVLGFLFIGSLIVPINDLIRLTLIVTGSDQKFQDFFVESSAGKSQINRNFEVASRIYARLEEDGVFGSSVENDTRQAALAGISAVLDEAKRVELSDKVQQRGVSRLLDAMNNPETRTEWIYRFADDDKFKSDLRFLRSEGLVSYVYDDYDTIVVQALGRQLLSGPSSSPTSSYVSRPAVAAFGPSLTPPDFNAVVEITLVEDYQSHDVTTVKRTSIGFDYSWFSFTINEPAVYVIDVLAQSARVDPILMLLGSPNPDDVIRDDDDGGENYNSRIVEELNSGKYYLAIRNLGDGDGEVRIVVGKISSSTATQMQ